MIGRNIKEIVQTTKEEEGKKEITQNNKQLQRCGVKMMLK
jgi:hypothetical protein